MDAATNEQGDWGMRIFSRLLMLLCTLAAGASFGRLPSISSAHTTTPTSELPQSAVASSISEPSDQANLRRAIMRRRVITVSVLNDVNSAVRPESITTVTDSVFAEYERELNI